MSVASERIQSAARAASKVVSSGWSGVMFNMTAVGSCIDGAATTTEESWCAAITTYCFCSRGVVASIATCCVSFATALFSTASCAVTTVAAVVVVVVVVWPTVTVVTVATAVSAAVVA
eukprot:Lankesteria_metandrocarpae@DN349_c0_g1_i1.p2